MVAPYSRREYGGMIQLLSFVCSTGRKGSKPRLWNIQNLGPVPPYSTSIIPKTHIRT